MQNLVLVQDRPGSELYHDIVPETPAANAEASPPSDKTPPQYPTTVDVQRCRDDYSKVIFEDDRSIIDETEKCDTKIRPQENDWKMDSLQVRDDRDEMKATTMYRMVEEVYDLEGQKHKLVFMTNKQAKICCNCPENLSRLIEVLDMPRPKLVIHFQASLGLSYLTSLQKIPQDPGFEGMKLKPVSVPWSDMQQAVEAQGNLVDFMVDVLIPLAEQTNALIMCAASPECELTTALDIAVEMMKAKWGNRMPFTILATEYRMSSLYNLPNMTSSLWFCFMKQATEWKLRNQLITELKENTTNTCFDLNPNASVYMLFDGINEGTHEIGDSAPRDALLTEMLSFFGRKVPCLAFRSGIIKSEKRFPKKSTGWSPTISALSGGIPVIVLDTRQRPDFIEGSTPEQRVALAISEHKKLCENFNMPDVVDAAMLSYIHRALQGEGYGGGKTWKEDHDGWHPVPLHVAIGNSTGKKGKKISSVEPDRNELADEKSTCPEADVSLQELTDATLRDLGKHRFQNFWDWLPPDMQEEGNDPQLKYLAYYDNWLAVTRRMFRSKGMHSANVYNTARAKNLVWKLVMLDQLPKQNCAEGLMTLRSAWDHIDICVHHARYYKGISKFAFGLQLILQVLVILVTTLMHGASDKRAATVRVRRLQDWLEPECFAQFQAAAWYSDTVVTRSLVTEDDLLVEGESFFPNVLFSLSLVNALILSLVAVWNPVSRWRQLRFAANSLESAIWKYRARVGEFQIQVQQSTSPEEQLSVFLRNWLDNCLGGLDLQGTAFSRQYGDNVYRHLQYKGKLSKISPKVEDDLQVTDDFHTPVKPEIYIQLRILPIRRFYSRRVPIYIRRRTFWIILGLLCSATSGACTFWGAHDFVALVGSVATASAAWMEFTDLGAKIERYNTTVKNLDKLLIWWRSLRDVERASKEMGSQLVYSAESIITGEFQAWQSSPAQENDKDGASKKGKPENPGASSSAGESNPNVGTAA